MTKSSKSHGTFTDLPGVFAGAIGCGIKPGRDDLSYIYLPACFSSAGVFTQNSTAAPCVEYTKAAMKSGKAKGVVINAGCANAATGTLGFRNAKTTSAIAAKLLRCRAQDIVVSSTGIIGKQLPMDKISSGLKSMLSKPLQRTGSKVARAIMTTDTYPKEVFLRRRIGKETVTVSGIAKGAGMIAPNMATMLGFLVTDARISAPKLRAALRSAVNDSFNMTSVDTDTSTNDMVLLFSTGTKMLRDGKELLAFQGLLTEACQVLAKAIARDGEGATKLIEVTVRGAKTQAQARKMAMNVVNSPLVKTAIAGADPNWGRIIAAAGKDPSLALDLKKLDVALAGCKVLGGGKIQSFKRESLAKLLRQENISIALDLKLGKGKARAWGCDLTAGYVEINTEYS